MLVIVSAKESAAAATPGKTNMAPRLSRQRESPVIFLLPCTLLSELLPEDALGLPLGVLPYR